jgi:hypothetical protein
MKRSSLQRKTPLARGDSTLKRTALVARPPKPRKTTPPKLKDTPRPKAIPSALAVAHMGRVAELGCCICRRPAEVHHCRSFAKGWGKATDFHTIPLCPDHHRLGKRGVAIHAGIQTWQGLHGTEEHFLLLTIHRLGFAHITLDDLRSPTLGLLIYRPAITIDL